MKFDLERSLEEFSNKHGAVLLGMHKELQKMQVSIDSVKQEVFQVESLKSRFESDIKSTAKTEMDKIHKKQEEAQLLYEKALTLLIEHKQREEAYIRKMHSHSKAFFVISCILVVLVGALLWMS